MQCEHKWILDVTARDGGILIYTKEKCSVCNEVKRWSRPWVEERPWNWVEISGIEHFLQDFN